MAYIITDYPELDDKLKHLPLRKRREIAFIMKTLFEQFAAAQKHKTHERKKNGHIVALVLFGSTARGSWVEDRGSGYFSDYDLLAVVDKEEFTDFEYWEKAEDLLIRENIRDRLKAPVGLIVHSNEDINSQLGVGRPFFIDIVRDGIMLYQARGHSFAKPGKLPPEQQRQEAQKYFDQWYPSSLTALELSRLSFGKTKGEMNAYMRDAAFLAHQATERIYHCLLLTLKLYSPKLHHIGKLRDLAEDAVPELADIWPRNKKFYRRSFELLRRAYVEGRYSPHYKITALQLQWLFTRIAELQERVKQICQTHLQAMAKLSR